MSFLPRIVIIMTIGTLLMVGLHYYAYTRLGHHLVLDATRQRVLKYVLIALFGMLFGSMFLARSLGLHPARWVYWTAYIWLGSLVILSVVLLGGDLARLGLWGGSRLLARGQPAAAVDDERRSLLARALSLATVGTAGTLIGYALYQGMRKVAVRKVALPLRKLPPQLSGFRVVQLTDIHVGPTIDGDWLRRVVDQVNALQPDLVAITGDLVDGPVARLREHVAPLADLRAGHGVYFVTGNHEYYAGVDAWLAEIGRLGIRVLRNECVTVRVGGRPGNGSGDGESGQPAACLDIIGVDDFHSGQFPGHGPDLPKAVAGRQTENPAILLAHQPAAVIEAAQHGIDLQLSGHTHGGQIWPWGFFVRLQQPYVAGLHQHGNTKLYVSCGTGYWGPPMRLGAPAEITEITLHSATTKA